MIYFRKISILSILTMTLTGIFDIRCRQAFKYVCNRSQTFNINKTQKCASKSNVVFMVTSLTICVSTIFDAKIMALTTRPVDIVHNFAFIVSGGVSYTAGGGGGGECGTTLGTVTYVDGQPTLTTTAGTAGHPIEGTYGPNGEISVTVEPVAVDGQQV